MKILKRLSKYFIILFLLSFSAEKVVSNEPIDIWNIEKKENIVEANSINNKKNIDNKNYLGIKIVDKNKNIIVNNSLSENTIKLAGLYDPAENGLSIDMWSNSNGNEIKYTLEKINSKKLSNFSKKIMDVALLTNSYLPSNNISS